MIYEIPYNLAQVSATRLVEPSKLHICKYEIGVLQPCHYLCYKVSIFLLIFLHNLLIIFVTFHVTLHPKTHIKCQVPQ